MVKAAEFPGLDGRLLVIFDGQCGFCHRSIRWFLRRDALDRMRFTPSESPALVALLARNGFAAGQAPGSLLVVTKAGEPGETVLAQSTGVIAMLRALPRPWRGLAAVLEAVPRPMRDFGYDVIAWLRYRLAGRYAVCPLPAAEERERFLA